MSRHVLYIMVYCIAMLVSAYAQFTITKYTYWFNNDVSQAVTVATPPQEILEIDERISTNHLPKGLHTFNIQFFDANELASSVVSHFFTNLPLLSASTQTIVACEYWFDSNYAQAITKTVTAASVVTVLDSVSISQLTDGLHTCNIRFKNSDGIYSSVVSSFFTKLPQQVLQLNTITSFELWFDSDYTNKQVMSVTPGASIIMLDSIVASQLTSGLHTCNIRFKDSQNRYSSVVSQFFTKFSVPITVSNSVDICEYWFDADYGNKQTKNISNSYIIEFLDSIQTASLTNGLHTFNIRFRNSQGVWSSPVSSFFTKYSESLVTVRTITEYEYWFDTDISQVVKKICSTPITTLSLIDSIQTDNITTGLHTLTFRFKDNTGKWSPSISSYFTKLPYFPATESTIVGYQYWFDADITTKKYTQVLAQTRVEILEDIDVSSLPNGFHTIIFQFKYANNTWSSPITHYFVKEQSTIIQPVISRLAYWFDDDEHTNTIILLQPTQVTTIDTLVSMIHIPKGKHVIHMQVGDFQGNWSVPISDSLVKLPYPIAYFTIDTIQGCDSLSVQFTNKSIDGDIYTWNFGDGNSSNDLNPKHTYLQSGVYSVSLQAIDTTIHKDSTKVQFNLIQIYDSPQVKFIVPSVTICDGDSVEISVDNTWETYTWNTSSSASSIIVKESGVYSVQITDIHSCFAKDSIEMTRVAKPIVFIGADTAICKGNAVVLDAQNLGATYIWNTGAITQTIVADTTGIYAVEVINQNNCSVSDTIQFIVHDVPAISLGTDTAICKGNTIELGPFDDANTYVWNTGDRTNRLILSESQQYSVIATNEYNCVTKDTILVTVQDLPKVFLGNDTVIKQNSELVLAGPQNMKHYMWSNQEISQSIRIVLTNADLLPQEYVLQVTDYNGCSNADTILITVTADNGIQFSQKYVKVYPNPVVDVLYIDMPQTLTGIEMVKIINEQGQIVYSTIPLVHSSIMVPAYTMVSGVYTVIVVSKEKVYATKILKK